MYIYTHTYVYTLEGSLDPHLLDLLRKEPKRGLRKGGLSLRRAQPE